jgi:hypothetical protein
VPKLKLRPGENWLRTDLVFVTGIRGYVDMHVTDQRLSFMRRSDLDTLKDALDRALRLFAKVNNSLLDIDELEVELTSIDRFWTWRPAFSGPPMIEVDNKEFCYFALVSSHPSPKTYWPFTDIELIREHFAAVEAAWKAATALPDKSP